MKTNKKLKAGVLRFLRFF